MKFYDEKTKYLKSLKLEDAYSFLLNNQGWLHNPNIDVSLIKGDLLEGEYGFFFNRGFNKNNPDLLGPHTKKETELFLNNGKPLLFDHLGHDLKRLHNYETHGNVVAIDEIYIHLYYASGNLSCGYSNDHASVTGTLFGYSNDAINFFLARYDLYKKTGNLKMAQCLNKGLNLSFV